jgi:plasmid stabilization system protein ParE
MKVVLHRLLHDDLREILKYYREKAGPELASEFYEEFERSVRAIGANPKRFHFVEGTLRRANLRRFPYHLLFREAAPAVRVLVLRHNRRHPELGTDRV